MIREVHHVHQKSWKKNSKKMAKRNHSKRSACSLAPSSRHYLPAYAKQEISQSIYNIIVPCIVLSCYIIPKIIQEMFQNFTEAPQSDTRDMRPVLIFSLGWNFRWLKIGMLALQTGIQNTSHQPWIRLYFSLNWAVIMKLFERIMLFRCLWLKKNSRLIKMLSITKFYKDRKISNCV